MPNLSTQKNAMNLKKFLLFSQTIICYSYLNLQVKACPLLAKENRAVQSENHYEKEQILGVVPLLKPVGNICNQNEVVVTPGKPIIPKLAANPNGPLRNDYSPQTHYVPAPVYAQDPPQNVPPPPESLRAASPCSQSNIPTVGAPQMVSKPLEHRPENMEYLHSLPRCSSCSNQPFPCNSCIEKFKRAKIAANPSKGQPQWVPPVQETGSYHFKGYQESPDFIPADAVSQQLVKKALEDEKVKIEGEIAYGFKTLPIELDHFKVPEERFPEEALFQLNGQVLEYSPEKVVFSKTRDPYRGTEQLMASKIPTQTKQLSLAELGFGPSIVEPSPYIRKDSRQEIPLTNLQNMNFGPYDGERCENCKDVEPGQILVKTAIPEKDNYFNKNPYLKWNDQKF